MSETTTTPTTTTTPAAPVYRVRFQYDEDASLETPTGTPLPGSEADYMANQISELINPADDPVTGARRPVPYEEYCRYWGNPDRHVVIAAIVERQCVCCGSWGHGAGSHASLWDIDMMDDSPELATITINTGQGKRTTYAPDDPAITGYLQGIVKELIDELTPEPAPAPPAAETPIDFDIPASYLEWHVIDAASHRSIERCDEPDHALTHRAVAAGTAYIVEATIEARVTKYRTVDEDTIGQDEE